MNDDEPLTTEELVCLKYPACRRDPKLKRVFISIQDRFNPHLKQDKQLFYEMITPEKERQNARSHNA